MFKTAFLQENVNNLKTLLGFDVNRDRRTRYTKNWSNLTLKCNANATLYL